MTNRKLTKTYYFIVEGETEQGICIGLKTGLTNQKI